MINEAILGLFKFNQDYSISNYLYNPKLKCYPFYYYFLMRNTDF